MKRLVVVTNILTPYRDPVYNILSNYKFIDVKIFYCSESEPNRNWNSKSLPFNHLFLSKKNNTKIHTNLNVFKELNKFNPDVVITSGFNPTMLISWIWVKIYKKKHITFSDANLNSEKNLSLFHKIVRYIVYKTSDSFIGASEGTLDLYKSYNISKQKMFKSCLAVNNSMFNLKNIKKKYDLMFCGQFVKIKRPLFFCRVAKEISKINSDTKVLILGKGPLKNECILYLKKNNVDFYDAGFVQTSELPLYYNQSRILLFPSIKDAWGLVSNEALAAGVPVIISSLAGAANELVIDKKNGYVIDNFSLGEWVEKTINILNNSEIENKMVLNSVKSVKVYNFNSAAKGISDAVNFCFPNLFKEIKT